MYSDIIFICVGTPTIKNSNLVDLKYVFRVVNDIRKYFSSAGREENYLESLKTLSSAKLNVDNFFDNVVVNDDDPIIKKNRLELLKMLCKSFENYFNFSKIEA